MGVDINGKIMVGVREEDFNWEGVELELDSLSELAEADGYWNHPQIKGTGLSLRHLRAENWDRGIFGFEIADSGSYSYKEISDPGIEIALAKVIFKRVFDQEAKIFICAYMW